LLVDVFDAGAPSVKGEPELPQMAGFGLLDPGNTIEEVSIPVINFASIQSPWIRAGYLRESRG
jgi:hypothetical protein